MVDIVFANSLSAVAAVFMSVSCLLRRKTHIYLFQMLECLFLIFAQLVFGQVGAVLSLSVSVIRNLLLVLGRYKRWHMILFTVITLLLGIALNTGGIIGIIPVGAGAIFTVSSFYAEKFAEIKLSLLVNIGLWIVYSAFILDFSTLFMNSVSFALNLASLIRYISRQKRST